MSDKKLSRRDFIKRTTATIDGLIGASIVLPTIAYFLPPALRAEEDTDSIDLGPKENYSVDTTTRFESLA